MLALVRTCASGRYGADGQAVPEPATPASQAAKVTALTDSTGGTAGTTLANVGTSFSQATLNNNFASLAATVNALVAALKRHGLMSS